MAALGPVVAWDTRLRRRGISASGERPPREATCTRAQPSPAAAAAAGLVELLGGWRWFFHYPGYPSDAGLSIPLLRHRLLQGW